MNSGNRLVFIVSIFGTGLVLATADARAPGAPRERQILVATELVPETADITLLDCATDDSVQRVELRFERITTDPDAHEMRLLLSHGVRRQVGFEWNAVTGELAYGPRAMLTPPAARGAAASFPASASCESR